MLLALCYQGNLSAQVLDINYPYTGNTSWDPALFCFPLPTNTVIGDDASIYHGGNSALVILSCATPAPLEVYESTPYTGGASVELAVSCGDPVVLEPDAEHLGIYKGGPSNDYFVECLEKPAIIDVDLPIYQGSRSYEEILSCDVNQLGEGTSFVGGISRDVAVSCNQAIIAGGGPYFGGASAVALTATACLATEESLTGENLYGGGPSRDLAQACISDVSLGEPVGGYFRGGASADGNVDCYLPPCLNLQPAVITSLGAVPVCVGKTITLKASPAATRKWQRYNTSSTTWDDFSTDPQIVLSSEQGGDFRLVSFSGSAGCADTSEIFHADFVTNIPQPVITIEGSNVICTGGTVALRSSQAQQYLWSNGSTSQTIWTTQGGFYTVTITDMNGCQATSEPIELIAGAVAAPVATIAPTGKTELCYGTSQTLTANAASAYQWSNGATSQAISVSTSGKYTVRITDANGCQTTADSVEIVVHDVRPVVSHPNGLTICYGAPVTLSLAPHTGNIQWYKDGAALSGKTGTTVQVTDAGAYHAVLDTLNCQFAAPVVTVNSNNTVTPLAKITPSHPVLCAGGDVTLTADAASKYAWSTGDNGQEIWTSTPGTYTLTVEDALGCKSTTNYVLNQVAVTIQPVIQAVAGQLDLCPSASVTLRVSEGTTFAWANGATTQQITVAYDDAGNYSATAYDTNGCAVTAATVTVNQVAEITPVVDAGNAVICGSEPLTLAVTPMDDSYTYEWSNSATTAFTNVSAAGNYSVAITTAEGCRFTSAQVAVTQVAAPAKPVITSLNFTITNDTIRLCPNQADQVILTSSVAQSYYWSNGESTQSITTTGEGKYAVMAVYGNTCSAVSDTVVVALKDNPVYIEVVGNETRLCPKGSIIMNITGAEAGSTFEWYKDGVLAGTQVSQTATSAGSYYAKVMGTGGCTETTAPVEITNFPTIVPEIIASGDPNLCPYDSVYLTVSEAVAYLWNTGDNTESIYASKAGKYIVAVTDEFGCVQKDSIEITVKPIYMPVIKTTRDVICQGDTLILSVPAPAGSTFVWSTSETTPTVTFDNPARFGNQVYWVEVTYPNGCTFRTPDKNVYVKKSPRQPEITVVGSNHICPDLTVALIATKSELYRYQWRIEKAPGVWADYPAGKTFGIVVDENGNYDVTIEDTITKCSSRSEVLELNSLSSASVEIYPKGPINICEKGGWVKLEAYDSQQRNVTYKWNTGETTKSIIVTQEGYYRVTVTELESGNSCEVTSPRVEVRNGSALPPPVINASGATTFCEGNNVTLSSTMASNGIYEWRRWTATDTTVVGNWRQLEVTESGEYMMVFTDSKGCKVYSKIIRVTVNPFPEAIIAPAGSFTVCGNGTITLAASAGQGYTYKWSAPTNATTRVLNASVGTHSVTVTSPQGCVKTSDPVIIRLATNQAPMPAAADIGSCEGEKAMLTATSSIVNAEIKWWDAATDGNMLGRGNTFETPVLNADYEVWVNVSSDNLCESPRRKVTVTVGPKVPVDITTPGNLAICNFGKPVALTATPAGGVFSGNGVNGTSFNPALVGSGIHTVYYTVINRGCPSVDSIDINVLLAPEIVFNSVPATICSNEAPITIDIYPDGGILKGNGLTGNTFSPANAGIGDHWLTYTVSDATCSRKDSVKITVLQAPQPVITNTQTVVGVATGAFALTATPTGGTFSGTGVVFSAGKAFFDPAIAGEGNHDISYTVTSPNGCSAIANITIRVVPKPLVDKPAVPVPACEAGLLAVIEPAYDLYGATLVSKGWLLDGVVFNPAVKTLTYADNGKTLQFKVVSGAGETISAGVQITVDAKPILGTITAPSAVCDGSLMTPTLPVVTSRGATVTNQGWLLDGAPFNPVATTLSYTDNGKMLQYYAVSACGNDTTLAVAITVNGIHIAPVTDPQTVCTGGTLTITAPSVTGNATINDAYWMFDGARVDLGTRVFTASDNGKKLKYVVESSCGTFESNEATVQTGAKSTAPGIVMNPLNGIICGTGSVTLSTANFATYQWYKGGVPFSTAATITVNETQAGNYTVEGANANGCQSELSAPATVTVQAQLSLSISGATTVCGENIESYTVNGLTGNATDYSYVWTAVGGTIQGSNINAGVNVKWTFGGVPSLELKVKHKVSECENIANTNITVNAKPIMDAISAPAAVCENNKIDPQVPAITVQGVPVTSQGWLLNKLPFSPAATNLTYADNGKLLSYYIASACGNDTTVAVAVAVNAAPFIFDIPDTYTVCAGGLLVPGMPIVTDRGVVRGDAYWMLDGVRVDLTTRRFADADEGKVLKYVVESSCDNTESNISTIHIGAKLPEPVVTMNPTNGYICATGSITLGASGYATYQWYRNGVAFATTAVITVNETQAGSFTVRGFNADGCESELSTAAMVSVQTPPTPTITGVNTVCEGAEATYNVTGLTGNASDYTYAWTIAGGTIVGAADAESVVVIWDFAGPHSLDLTVTHTATGCATVKSFNTLTINPLPTFTVTNPAPVCPGGTVSLLTTVPVDASVTYAYYNADQMTLIATPAAVPVLTTGTIYYVQSTKTATTCRSEMKPIVVTGKPAPVVTFDQVAQAACDGKDVDPVYFSSTMPGTTYAWTNNLPGIGLAASGATSSTPSFTAVNKGAAPITATITVTPTAGGCVGTPKTFTITANPNPTFTVTVPATVCAESEVNLLTWVTTDPAVTYTFYENDQTTVISTPGNQPIPEGATTWYVQSANNTTGCQSTMKAITFTGIPAPVFALTKDTITMCQDVLVNLSTAVPVNASVDYLYYQSDGTTLVTNPTAVTPPAGDNIYYVQSKVKTTGCLSAKHELVVKVHAMPTVHIETPQGTSICHNSTIALNAITTGKIDYLGWHDSKGATNNTVQFAPGPAYANVVYNPDPSEAGKTIKLYVRVRDGLCPSYVADTVHITVLPQPTAASLKLVTQPVAFQEMCTDTVYEVKVKAANLGDLHKMKIKLHDINASGIDIKGASIKQPYTSASWAELTNSTSDGTGKIWTLPGTLAGGDSVLVQFTVAAECDFQSGLTMNVNLNAENACGDVLPEKTITTKAFTTKQDVSQLNRYDLSSNFSITKVTNNTSDTVIWQLKAVVDGIQPTDSEKETMQILIPDGLTVIPNSYNPVLNAPDRSTLKYSRDAFGTKFQIPIKSGLHNGDEIIAELKFHAIGASCQTFKFYAEIIFSDSIECAGKKCTFHETRGSVNPQLEVERYKFSLGSNNDGRTIDELWYGKIEVKAETQFFAGDPILIDFYVDRDNNTMVNSTDTMVHSFTYITKNVPAQGLFTVDFDSVHIEPQKQLLAVVRGNSLCSPTVIPVATLMGTDTVCQWDTTYYYTTSGMQNYKWLVIKPVDAVSGATPVRIPLEGSSTANYINENIARVVWKKQGDYTLWAQYTIPATPPYEVSKTYFPVRVDDRPVVALTGGTDTTVCEGTRVELSHFFKETTGIGTISYYRIESDGGLTYLSNQSPLYVSPSDLTFYRAVATAPSGCESLKPVDFSVHINKMPEIGSINVYTQPDCGANNGSIKLSVTEGSGNYRYSIDAGATYADLPASGLIENLPVGSYRVYVKDKILAGCAPSISDPVSLNPANSTLRAVAQVANAGNCTSTDGTIKLSVNGGVAPYRYRVNNGSYVNLPSNGLIGNSFPAGSYIITVMDADNCIATAGEIEVIATSGPKMTLNQLSPAVCKTDGTANISFSGGTPGYSYRLSGKGWITMTGTSGTIGLTAGLHEIFAKDAAGCQTSDTIRITNTAGLSLGLTGTTQATCNGIGGGSIGLMLNGGTPPLTLSIDGGKTTMPASAGADTIQGLPAGTYHILLTDNNGCTSVLEGVGIGENTDLLQAVDNRIYTYKNQGVKGNLAYDDFESNRSSLAVTDHTAPLHGTITVATNGDFSYTPDIDYTGKDSVSYTITNDCGFTSKAWLHIRVLDTGISGNRAPIAQDDDYVIKTGQSLSNVEVRKNDIDPDGDVLSTPVVISTVSRGVLTQNGDGTFNYTPNAGFTGVDVFTYRVCDPDGACAEAQVHITVLADDIFTGSIVALPDIYTMVKNTDLTVSNVADGVLKNDVYPQSSTPAMTIVSQPENGTLTFNATNGTFKYTPNQDYVGVDGFTYVLCTNTSAPCDTARVTIFVSEQACATMTLAITALDEACMGDRVILDTNTGYDTYQWTIVSGTGGTMEGAGTAAREYLSWSIAGTKVVSVTVTDANGCSGTVTKTIVIKPRPATWPIYRIPNN